MSKNPNVNTFVCNLYNKETFLFAEIVLKNLKDLSNNSKLKKQTKEKLRSYSYQDPNNHVIDPTNFSYYLTHEFHKLHNKNSSKTNKTKFSVLHTNICSLQGNFDNLEQLLNKIECEFDIIALTETWNRRKLELYPWPTNWLPKL